MADIVIVEDEPVLARSIVTYLERRGYVSDFALDLRGAQALMERQRPKLVVLDYRLGAESGLDLLHWIRLRFPETHVVMMTGHGDIGTAVQAMKAGARDFLVKPVPLATLAALARDMRIDELAPWSDPTGLDRIVGRSAETAHLKTALKRLADQSRALGGTGPGVTIAGAPGTGKITAARALAEAAASEISGPVQEFDCRSDAVADLPDRLAGAGTLILRRVDHLPPSGQAVLAGLLERADAPWTIATTAQDLARLAAEGGFDPGLLYRLQVEWLDLPPLSNRPADILPLAETVARRAARRHGRPRPRFLPEARARLVGHDWPGNAAELVNVIERAVLASEAEIGPDAIRFLGNGGGPAVPNLRRMEEEALETALSASGGNVSHAARLLGISRDTMRYRMEKFGLPRG